MRRSYRPCASKDRPLNSSSAGQISTSNQAGTPSLRREPGSSATERRLLPLVAKRNCRAHTYVRKSRVETGGGTESVRAFVCLQRRPQTALWYSAAHLYFSHTRPERRDAAKRAAI